MLQHHCPDDFVLATGEKHSVRDFCTRAFARADITLEWRGSGVDEKAVDLKTGRILVDINPRYFRPSEVDLLVGIPEKFLIIS